MFRQRRKRKKKKVYLLTNSLNFDELFNKKKSDQSIDCRLLKFQIEKMRNIFGVFVFSQFLHLHNRSDRQALHIGRDYIYECR